MSLPVDLIVLVAIAVVVMVAIGGRDGNADFRSSVGTVSKITLGIALKEFACIVLFNINTMPLIQYTYEFKII